MIEWECRIAVHRQGNISTNRKADETSTCPSALQGHIQYVCQLGQQIDGPHMGCKSSATIYIEKGLIVIVRKSTST